MNTFMISDYNFEITLIFFYKNILNERAIFAH